MKKTILRKYANLIVRCGANVQKGQTVLVFADLDQPEFVQMVVDEAYKAGAAEVTVQWNYQPLSKIHYRYRTVKSLGTVKEWEKARQEYYCDVIPARIILVSEDPDGMKGINMEKVSKARRMSYPVLKPYIDRRENKEQWCIAAVPGAAWAKKVFPESAPALPLKSCGRTFSIPPGSRTIPLPPGGSITRIWQTAAATSTTCTSRACTIPPTTARISQWA